MNAQYAPEVKVGTAGTTASTLAFSTTMGSVAVENLDSTNACFIRLDGTNPVATNSNGNWQLSAGKCLSFDNVQVNDVRIICAAGLTAVVQAMGIPSSGSQGVSA